MPIRDWPKEQRPRERLIRDGPSILSDAELLAVFLRTGVAGQSAIELARVALIRFKTLSGLFSAPLSEFTAIKGLGQAKFAQLQAVLEMAKRTLEESLREGPALGSSTAVREYLRLEIGLKPYEVFFALFVDSQNRLLEATELFRGTLAETSVYPREIIKAALRVNAAAVIFAHNHPSGIAAPSLADRVLTRTLQLALDAVEVKTLDHLVVTGSGVFSFADAGHL